MVKKILMLGGSDIQVDKDFEPRIFYKHFNALPGSFLDRVVNTNNRLGILLVSYKNPEEA